MEFLVNSAILRSGTDPKACAEGAAKQLAEKGIKGVRLKACFCCSPERRVAFTVEGIDREAVLEAFNQINIPVASIFEAAEVRPKQ